MQIIAKVLVVVGCLATMAHAQADLWVDKIEITGPENVTYSAEVPVDITFTVWVGNRATDQDDIGQLLGAKVYFTNNAQFEDATKKSYEMIAVMPESPRSVEPGDAMDYGGFEVAIVVNKDDCKDYTHICAVILHEGSDTESAGASADDDGCLALGAGEPGGVLSCPQPAASDDGDVEDDPDHANHSSLSAMLCITSLVFSVYAYLQ